MNSLWRISFFFVINAAIFLPFAGGSPSLASGLLHESLVVQLTGECWRLCPNPELFVRKFVLLLASSLHSQSVLTRVDPTVN